MSFFNTAWKRLQAETPIFFKKVRRMGATLMATGGSCLGAQIIPNVTMPPSLIEIGKDVVIGGFIMTLVASLACQDPDDIHKNVDPNQPPKP